MVARAAVFPVRCFRAAAGAADGAAVTGRLSRGGCNGGARALGDHEALLEGVSEQLDDRRRVVVLQRVEDLYSSDRDARSEH